MPRLQLYFLVGFLFYQSIFFAQSNKKDTVRCHNVSGYLLRDKKELLFLNAKGKAIQIAGLKKNNLFLLVRDSNSKYQGRIYACWDDEKFSAGNSDIFLAYSDDAGETWTEPILITYRPNHKAQFMPQLFIENNGRVDIFYYDTQNSPDNTRMDIFLAQSRNGGLKFDYYKLNTGSFISEKDHPLKISSSNPPTLSWLDENKIMIDNLRLTDTLLEAINNENRSEEINMPRTFVFSDTIKINFNLKSACHVSAIITKPLEPGFEKTIIKNKEFNSGENMLIIKSKKIGLQKGNYTLTLYYNNRNTYTWIIDE